MFRSSNPALGRADYASPESWDDHNGPTVAPGGAEDAISSASTRPGVMTIQGTVNKTFFMLALCITTATVAWNVSMADNPAVSPGGLFFGSLIGSLVLFFICLFAPKTTPVTGPMYALVEGLFIGSISAMYAQRFATTGDDGGLVLNTGLVFNAGLLTFSLLGGMLVGYTTKVIRPGPMLPKILTSAMLGIIMFMLMGFVASMFGSYSMIGVFSPSNGGLLAIGISLVLVAIGTASFLLDFQQIEEGARRGAPKYMEWYSAFGLVFSIAWLYVQALRLMAQLTSRD